MKYIKKLAAPVVVLLVSAGAIAWAAQGGGNAWIDAPLGHLTVTSTPVEVVAHAASPDGITELRLDVDGSELDSVGPAVSAGTLVQAAFTWTPDTSGIYTLEVFGRTSAGEWVGPGLVRVTVDLGLTTPSTQPSTTTTQPRTTTTSTTAPPATTSTTTTTAPTSTTSSTAPATTTTTSTTLPPTTTTTTSCDLGVPAPTGPSGTVSTPSPTLTWSYNGCREPSEFEIQVSRDSTFTRVEHGLLAPGDVRSLPVGPLACDTWYWRIRTLDLDTGPFSGVASFTVAGPPDC